MINYKFNEEALIEELHNYIDSTYNQHYGGENIQTSEIMIDRDRGLEFFLGNIDKYSLRYGKKGDINSWRKDLMKIAHYSILALYAHDKKNSVQTDDFMIQLDDIILTDPTYSDDIVTFLDGDTDATFTINLSDSK